MFEGLSSTWYFNTNKEIRKYFSINNLKMIRKPKDLYFELIAKILVILNQLLRRIQENFTNYLLILS